MGASATAAPTNTLRQAATAEIGNSVGRPTPTAARALLLFGPATPALRRVGCCEAVRKLPRIYEEPDYVERPRSSGPEGDRRAGSPATDDSRACHSGTGSDPALYRGSLSLPLVAPLEEMILWGVPIRLQC